MTQMPFFQSLESWMPHNYGLVVQVFIIILIALIINFLLVRALNRLARRLKKTKMPWDNVLAEALVKPAGYFVWLVGLSIALNTIDLFEEMSGFLKHFQTLRDIALTALFGWFVIRMTRGIEMVHVERGKADVTTIQAIAKLIKTAVFITLALFVLNSLGYSISGFLAFGGIGGIALGFAAKDLLANFFGGLVIYLERPFSVGDWIKSPDQEIEGYVEHIGWRSTKIRTFEKRPLYVPNSSFNQISIQNPSRMSNRRIKEIIGVRYEDAPKIRQIVNDIREMIRTHPDIDTNMVIIVNFVTFAASSCDILIYTFTKTIVWTEYHDVQQDVLLKAMDIVHVHGADIAFPTTQVHLLPEEPSESLI
jgi:MscS family membrane protein